MEESNHRVRCSAGGLCRRWVCPEWEEHRRQDRRRYRRRSDTIGGSAAAMEPQGGDAFEFGAFRFDPAERVLYRGPERVPLSPKVADTLFVLLTHHGRVVEKNELIQLVWPDTFVEEGGLTRNISALRKALGDDAEGSRHIETIPKRGYRFVAPIGKTATQPSRPGIRYTIAAILVGAALL